MIIESLDYGHVYIVGENFIIHSYQLSVVIDFLALHDLNEVRCNECNEMNSLMLNVFTYS